MSETNNKNKKETKQDKTPDTPSDNKSEHKKPATKTISYLHIASWFFAALIIISAGAGYYLWSYVTETKENIEQNVSSTKTNVSSLTAGLKISENNLKTQIKTLTILQSELSNSVEALLSKSTHMRKDWLVSEAEYLVKLAANRLILEGDIATAITALTNADARLLEAGDPGLLFLRQEISNRLTDLKAITVVDISGISIKISSVIQQINKLPLVTPDPESIKNSHEKAAQDTSEETAISWSELTSKVVTDLTSLVRIRKHGQKVQPLLTPEQGFYLTQNLKLQLEQARTALLHQQENTFRERLTQSISWIEQYFDISKTPTQSAIKILSDLNKINLTPETPDLSYALGMFTNFQAGIRLKNKSAVTKTKKVTAKKNKQIKEKKAEVKAMPVEKPNVTEPPKSKSTDQESIKNNEKSVPLKPVSPGVSL